MLIAVAAIVCIFSYNTVWLGDDMSYGFDMRPGMREQPVQSFSDIIASQNIHYFSVNGRYFAHTLVQGFCGILGHVPFAVANALMYIAFLLLLFRLCKVDMSDFRSTLSVTLLGLLTFQTKMTPTCQIGYIWSGVFVMLFLLFFFRSEKGNYKWWQLVLLTLYCIIAGNSNEAVSLPVCGSLFVYWLRNIRRCNLSQYILAISFAAGALASALSPGTMHRTEGEPLTLLSWLNGFKYFVFIPRSTWLLLIVVLYKRFHDKWKWREIAAAGSFFWIAWAVGVAFLMVIAQWNNRAFFGAELMALILAVRMLKQHRLNNLWLSVAGLLLVGIYILQFMIVNKVGRQYAEVGEQYAQSSDGIVYMDIDNESPLPLETIFTPGMQYTAIDAPECKRNMATTFRTLYPGRPDIRIVPAALKPLRGIESGNRIVSLPGDVYLFIRSKKQPAKFIMRTVSALPGLHTAPVEKEIEFSAEQTAIDDICWQAVYLIRAETLLRATRDEFIIL